MALAVWHFVSGAPLTYGWLFVLTITTIIQHQLPKRQLHIGAVAPFHQYSRTWQRSARCAVFQPAVDRRPNLEPYLLLFTLFLAPAEHWLGHLRWLTVGLTAHILATYISEGILYFAIEEHDASERLVHARDIGVSYFLVGLMAVLAYHIARPWRWGYIGVLFVIFGFPLFTMDRTRAELHRDRPLRLDPHRPLLLPDGPGTKRAPWNPAKVKGAVQRLLSRQQAT